MKHTAFLLFLVISIFIGTTGCKKNVMSEGANNNGALKTGIVPMSVATDIAQNFFSLNSAGKQANKEILSEETLSEDSEPYIYVYNFKGGGFLLVSAEYGDIPILAHSDKNPFNTKEAMNFGLAIWLNDTKARIQQIRTKQLSAEEASTDLWNSYSQHTFKFDTNDSSNTNNSSNGVQLRDSWRDCSTAQWNRTTINPLLQTSWGQGCGYNNTCPEKSGSKFCERAPTGCVATLMAQLVRFHQNPTRFDYSLMPNEIVCSGGTCATGTSALANLMNECGLAVGMTYGANVSTATTSDVPGVLTSWGYKGVMSYNAVPDFYNSGAADDIRNNRPVIFRGNATKIKDRCFFGWCSYVYLDGHAWLCDGMDIMTHRCYTDIRAYSMNWGFGSNANGFYGSPQPRGLNSNFQYLMHTINNIHP